MLEFLLLLPVLGELIICVLVIIPLGGLALFIEGIVDIYIPSILLGLVMMAVSAPFVYDFINIFLL